MKSDYVWAVPFQAALLETDNAKLQGRISVAQAAIDDRLHELQQDHGGTPEERHDISDALAALNVIRREKLSRLRGGAMEWRELYRLAVTEVDRQKMSERITAVRQAIHETMHAGPSEKETMEHALRALTVLENESRSWSGSGS